MLDLVRRGNLRGFIAMAEKAEPADVGEVLSALDEEERIQAVEAMPRHLSAAALVEMPDEAQAEETFAALPPEAAVEIVEELPDDDAADLVGGLDPEDRRRILAELESTERTTVEQLLQYDPETAGGLMTRQVVTVLDTATAGEAIESLRRQAEAVEDLATVYVVDAARRLRGVLPLKRLVTSPAERPVRELMEEPAARVAPEEDQEEVARVISHYNLPSVPVVDAAGTLLGQVTFDDVIDVVEEEQTEDLLKFGGVSGDEELAGRWTDAVKSRLPWLTVNLATAFLAGAVAASFQDRISRHLGLVFWMPVIAGMGGNAGTQALAVTVRRLALGLIPPGRFLRTVGKELAVGCINGLAMGAIAALVSQLLGQGPLLGLVVTASMVGNLFIAGFAGAFVPMFLERIGVDPAVASSVFVTTFTDVCGFFLLFGLTGWMLGV